MAMTVWIYDAAGNAFARDVLTAPMGGEFEPIAERCPVFSGSPDLLRGVDVSGQAVAYQGCDANGQRESVVRDYSGAPPLEQAVPSSPAGGLRIAGRYVAALEDDAYEALNVSAVAVHDRFTGELVYRLTKETTGLGVHSLALQEDGKLAFSFGDSGGGQRVAWASPAEPYPHVLALPRRNNYVVQIAGDQIGYQAGRDAPEGLITRAVIGVADLTGRSRRLGTHGEGATYLENFDFDGERATWWSYGCRSVRIHVVRVDGRPTLAKPRAGCALRFTRPARVQARSRVRLYVDCFGFAGDKCSARRLSITTAAGGRTVIARGSRQARVRLTDAGRRLMARRGRLRVRVAAVLVDETGRHEPRRGKTTLQTTHRR
jgi:hypothetical protein